ncbi:alpha/beta fold hydrolase [Zoogloea dura]|jgi:proline iminopeptidase|uniref:Proline iminopeptidase n=1 Tax=Zoogloea dura TaxID=2728840 RepID=A0A848GAD1_9RHOO|nr:alpha/beta fold hydrolase [Zoogloea dura]NML27855.1 alpha/beta fold hydrolase [Zoogloea dura]
MSEPSSFLLPVGDGHRLHVETSGNPAGEPVVLLHGGPGSGCSPRMRDLYDPVRHFLVAFDQRGAGRSEPSGETRANTTAQLVADLERLRCHLGIARWRVTGGSWGATLALAYAMTHRQAVSGLVLRSSFLPGHGNVEHFFAGLAGEAPVAWQALSDALPEAGGRGLLAALATRLSASDPAIAEAAALAWLAYEQGVASPGASAATAMPDAPQRVALARKYRLQAHYLQAGCFLDEADFLAGCETLEGLPVVLIHGREDRICPPANAERLHAHIPGSRLIWIDGCGHDPFHPAMVEAWRAALASPPGP